MIWTIVITVLLTLLVAALAMNFARSEKKLERKITHKHAIADPQFKREMSVLLGPAVLSGNRIIDFQNGDEIFPAMLEAIQGAKSTITFETYIYWSGDIGKQFSDALSERARAGVKIHMIVDWAGSIKMDDDLLKEMQDAGVHIEKYRPLHWYNISRLNNRTHRKLLVVDGRVGFTGGVGIADVWLGDAQSKDQWRDSHYQIEGPAVAQMQSAFNDNWIKTRAKVLFGPGYFPELPPAGESLAQVFRSSRGEGSESVRLMYLLSIASATKRIQLQAAYFVPDELAIDAFIAARKRGVEIEIIVPGPHIDAKFVQSASRSLWGKLLDAGVKIYEYQPTMYHCKVFIVDDLWTSVGSTNFDDRSFRLNDEANLNIYDAAFAREQAKEFEIDKSNSRLMTRAEFKDRSAIGKLYDHAAGMFRRQL